MKPIGILGGGQLARMLVLESHCLGWPTTVLSPNEADPARAVTGQWVKGDPGKSKDLEKFMHGCSSVTFESEFYDTNVIANAAKSTGVRVWPDPKVMARLQDRLSQKNLFDEYELPTAKWRPVDSSQDALVAYVAFDGQVVFKKRRGGYDGNGTFVVRSDNDLGHFANQGVKDSFIAEEFVRFIRELAVIAVRDRFGGIFFYPFVESKQQDSRCLWVKGPVRETRGLVGLKKSLTRFLNGINYVGAMGIELFETKSGFFINEIAPRVHNTGHYTVDAFTLGQFALHLNAVAGKKITGRGVNTPQATAKAFAMWNLLGSHDSSALTPWEGTLNSEQSKFHWYGKSQTRLGRKMGHVNCLEKNPELALREAQKMAKNLREKIGF